MPEIIFFVLSRASSIIRKLSGMLLLFPAESLRVLSSVIYAAVIHAANVCPGRSSVKESMFSEFMGFCL